MNAVLHKNGKLYVSKNGLWYESVAILSAEYAVNEFLENRPYCGLLSVQGNAHVIVSNCDRGLRELPTKSEVLGGLK